MLDGLKPVSDLSTHNPIGIALPCPRSIDLLDCVLSLHTLSSPTTTTTTTPLKQSIMSCVGIIGLTHKQTNLIDGHQHERSQPGSCPHPQYSVYIFMQSIPHSNDPSTILYSSIPRKINKFCLLLLQYQFALFSCLSLKFKQILEKL